MLSPTAPDAARAGASDHAPRAATHHDADVRRIAPDRGDADDDGGGRGAGSDQVAPVPCPTCGTTIGDRYCPRCGEKRTERTDLTVARLAHELWEHVASVDAKLPRTLWLLVRRPGFLADEFSRGARGAYTRPLQLYLLTSVAFFLVAPRLGLFRYEITEPLPPTILSARGHWLVERIARRGRELGSLEVLRDRFNESVGAHMGLVFLLVVPVLALVVAALHPRARRFASEHLVFTVHLTTFILVTMLGAGAVGWLLGRIDALAGVSTLYPALALAFATVWGYGALAMRRYYGDSAAGATLRALVLAAGLTQFPMLFWRAVTTLTWLLI